MTIQKLYETDRPAENEEEIRQITDKILPPDKEAEKVARLRWDGMGKPLGSLGKLEDAVVQIAGMMRTPEVSVEKKALVVFCADNGVVAEGISQCGPEVTATVAENFLDGKSCAAILCRKAGADLFPVDIGMAVDTPRVEKRKIAYGTKNMAIEPAMTREQAAAAVRVGMQKACELREAGYRILAAGEMGIGNTTVGSAMTAVLLGVPAEEVTGRGAGLSSEGLERKICVICRAIDLHRPDPADPFDVLAKVGGFDIAGMAGLFLGGACCGIPVVMDGFLSSVAALTAVRIAPACAPYILASHVSGEPAARRLLDALGKEAFLTCDMRLGEGSGAATLFPLLDMAVEVYRKMSSFSEAGIEPYRPLK
ncbi:MAG: nicotinate-nucleotide--dimethylbenzimidazole phosphoribosyltransferase [Clostridiales bacterium]|nr:nicotinate-nucleotide--dimethylbenzimidazole phosphoribosyltransferase [Clostridiales bacterium]